MGVGQNVLGGRHRAKKLALAAGTVLMLARAAWGQTTNWVGGVGDWFDPANWDVEVPTINDTANIDNGGTAQIASGSAIAGTLYLGANAGESGSVALSQGQLSVFSLEYVGYSGTGSFTQTNGTNIAAALNLGANQGAVGTYTFSGGVIESGFGAANFPPDEYIGTGGTGTFTQTGGQNFANNINLGNLDSTSGASGTYNLVNGTLTATAASGAVVIRAGGVINQSGGQFVVAGSSGPGGIQVSSGGTFNQTGGTFSAGDFAESGGSVSLGPLTIGSGGNLTGGYSLSGGTLKTPAITINSKGQFSLSVGMISTPTLTVNSGGSFQATTGTLAFNSCLLNGGTLSFPTLLLDSGAPVPIATTTSGTGTPVFTFSTGTLGATNAYLGFNAGVSLFTQTAGLTYSDTNFYVAYNAASNASYTLQSGSLTANAQTIGYSGNGTTTQTGGTNSATSLTVGDNSGSVGTYTQSGGTNTPGNLQVAEFPGSTGIYNLSSGTLSDMNSGEVIGAYGKGAFNQTGGTNTALDIFLGQQSGSVGSYALIAGQLQIAGNEVIGESSAATFTQTGGVNTASTLDVTAFSPGTSSYFLSGGTLNGGTESMNDAFVANAKPTPGAFVQTGGTNNARSLSIGGGATYVITGGTLKVAGPLAISGFGNNGTGTLTITNTTASAATVTNGGQISLNGPTGTNMAGDLTVTGTYEQGPGELEIALGGPTALSQYGVVNVGGQATLGGILAISLANNFIPYYGETFDVLNAQSLSDTFIVELPGGRQSGWTVSYTSRSVIITALPEPSSLGVLALTGVGLLKRKRRSIRR